MSTLYPGEMSEYRQSWLRYKRLRNLFIIMLLGFLPFVRIADTLSQRLFHSAILSVPLVLIYFVILYAAGFRLAVWRCPRCGKWFAATWWYNLGFLARRCVHCGLRKYET